MNININILTPGQTASFAKEELLRCLALMDPTVTEGKGGLCLTLSAGDDRKTDTVKIAVTAGKGEIAGSNPVSLLIAAYRFLYELGCRFTLPGKDGEHIPEKTLLPDEITVNVTETASYRHRGVCMEGAVSEENVFDMIDFLPKVGMNSYYVQFRLPRDFFRR